VPQLRAEFINEFGPGGLVDDADRQYDAVRAAPPLRDRDREPAGFDAQVRDQAAGP
jgi:hypothetical protein